MNKPKVGMLGCLAILFATCSGLHRASANQNIDSTLAQDASPAQTFIHLEPVLTDLTSPLYVTNAHDGSNRLFIVERPGRIKVLQPGGTAPTVFLDITSKVRSGGEQGLLGLAFHPQFATNGRFFVHYTRQPNVNTNVVAEYRVSATESNLADPDSEAVLLVMPQPFANHNGGMIEFGPDGLLYIGKGDGGSAFDPGNRAQDIEELLGKLLRIDVDNPGESQPYSSPADNPFFGDTPGRDEIYALGLRNPWRFSFDRATGELYLGDVGQNAREEIDVVTRGGNYGWRVLEGTLCTGRDPDLCSVDSFIAPLAEYVTHEAGRCSVTGGYVYRGTGSSLPVGAYVFGDYCSGEIFLLSNGTQSVLLDTNLNISSFGEDEAGEIYVVGLGGTLHRITSVDPPPQVYTLTANPSTVAVEEQLTVSWTAPAGRPSNDWIGLYRVGDPDTSFIAWQYAGGASSGNLTFTAPSAEGEYEFRYFLEDDYNKVATSNTVTVTTVFNPEAATRLR